MWLIFALASAVFLGCNDAIKKFVLNNNSVITVVFLSSFFCSLLLSPILLASVFAPEAMVATPFFVPEMGFHTHILIFLKSGMVLLGWLFIDTAIKHLPLTIVSPVKASQPVFVLLGAMSIFSERLNLLQWAGVALSLFSFFILSKSGQKEGIYFRSNRWVFCIVLGVLVNVSCGLFDKFLMVNYAPMAVFVWFSLYLTGLVTIVFLVRRFYSKGDKFVWRWQIILVSLFICLSDFTYFYSLSSDEAMVSIVSMIRRSGIVISFLLGAWFFHEKNLKGKVAGLVLMLISMVLLFVGSINQGA